MPNGFEIKDRAAAGRLGILETPHGKVRTPTLLPVVNPNLNLIPPRRMKEAFGVEILITNSYILRQNADLSARATQEGVHRLLDWDGPIMTDSGTFQSYMYGSVDVAPREILEFQKRIGVDIGTILDVFTTPDKNHREAEAELDETLQRAREAAEHKGDMMLAATVQGGVHPDLREKAARGIAALDADVAPIGGVVPLMEQGRYATLARLIVAAKRHLPSGRPVHLFGAGHPLVFPLAAALGCDLFDSASYAKYAKDGRLMFPWGTRSLDELEEFPCGCAACQDWKDPAELRSAPGPERERVLGEHNLHVSFAEIRRIRQAIRDGNLWELVEERAAQNPGLFDALRVLREAPAAEYLEAREPISQRRAFTYRSSHSMDRPAVRRLRRRLLERYRIRGDACHVLPERTKPYTDAYAPYLDAFVKEASAFVVDTPFGPVPLELDLTFPIAQSQLPDHLDAEADAARRDFQDAFLGRVPGCDILPADLSGFPTRADGTSPEAQDEFDRRRVRAVADHQWGPAVSDALLAGHLTFVRSPNNRRVRNILADGAHVASLRAEDGLLSLRWAGAQRIQAGTSAPTARLIIDADAGPFVADGKNVIARTVQAADPDLRPGDDALVVTPDDHLVGVARLVLSAVEIPGAARGVAARTTDQAPRQAGPATARVKDPRTLGPSRP